MTSPAGGYRATTSCGGIRCAAEGWYPDYQLRLMRVDAAQYDPERQVHEIVMLEGQAGPSKRAFDPL